MKDHLIKIDEKKCIGCSLCAKTCVAHNIELHHGKAKTILDDCLKCGQCSAVCPRQAITITGYDTEPISRKEDLRLDPDTVLEVIRFRRTIRQFQNKKIPAHVLDQILEAGRLTHTAKNMQDLSFIVLDKEKDKIEHMAVRLFRKIKPIADLVSPMAKNLKIDDDFFFFRAPTVIVILAKDKTNGILAAQNMEFLAEANGLGVLFSGFFTTTANLSRKIKKSMHVPKGKKIAATLVLGYPDIKFQRCAQREKLDVRFM